MGELDLDTYAHNLLEEVRAAAEAEGCEPNIAFASLVLDQFCAYGHSEDAIVSPIREHGVDVTGYGLSTDGRCLDLFLVYYSARADAEHTIDRAVVDAAFKRLENFLHKAASGALGARLDKGSEAAGICRAVQESVDKVEKIRLFVVSNARSVLRDGRMAQSSFHGRPVQRELWDLRRLANWAHSGSKAEPIVAEFPHGLPFLTTPQTDKDHEVLLAIVPGENLGQLYAEHGGRLLELNVRSFLQTRGAVNKGIQETLRSQPERFLAYNNGISATASNVDVAQDQHGVHVIRRIHNLQIVNGGQTTASLHAAARARIDLSAVFVQMKLTVVAPEKLDTIVPQISAYSNTQNKVTASDLKANSSFHVEIEQIMRTLWAPATPAHPHDTHWFYERARGQYANSLAREATPARQKIFRTVNPATQKFVKSDLAKFEHSWEMLPHLVSRGAEKNFVLFTERIEATPPAVDKTYCRHLVAKAILFRRTDKIVARQNFGGYKANIVTYTVAKLAQATSQRIDLERIWREQDLSAALLSAVTDLSPLVQKIITSPAGGSTHVGEWTKKEQCWHAVRDLDWAVPDELATELAEADTHDDDLRAVTSLGAKQWETIAEWGRTSGLLDAAMLATAAEIARALAQGWIPAGKHLRAGAEVLVQARKHHVP